MTNVDPRTPSSPKPPARTAPKLFDAQNATGTLLLLTGSLALGLTAFWITPNKTSTQAAATTSGTTTSSDAGQAEQYASNTYTYQDDDPHEDDDWGTPQPTYQQNQYQAQPGFSPQPMQSARGWTRGS